MVANTGDWMGPDITSATATKGGVWDFAGRSAKICQIDWHGLD
jgi:hypothetical protein